MNLLTMLKVVFYRYESKKIREKRSRKMIKKGL